MTINLYDSQKDKYEEERPLSFSEASYVSRCLKEGMVCPPSMIRRYFNPPAQKIFIPEVKVSKIEINLKPFNLLEDNKPKKKNFWDL